MLTLDRLGRRFGTTIAVAGATLDIPAGQMVGIIGRSGSGKSTLLRLVARLIDPGLTLAAAYVLFLGVLLFRPQGLFGKKPT